MNIAVTGAFGYSGKYITRRLLAAGHQVITLTNSPERNNPFEGRVRAFPFHFDEPRSLEKSLQGTEVLINTYWVRFDHQHFTHAQAVINSQILFQAAKTAGVHRIVHVSITNPDIRSDLPYFRGKAEVELALQELGISYCILRPTVLFGKEDILINNIAWSLRHLPAVGVFGDGSYRLQPIYVDDLAAAACTHVLAAGNATVNATGPETLTYRQLMETVRAELRLRRPILGVPPELGLISCRLLGLLVHDVIITREEIRGLMENRLYVDAPPLGTTSLTEWVGRHRETLGRHYTSEMARRIDRVSAYRSN
jgi:NADH dehydrogenase